ncbi:MAG: bifunctional methylenetetrahydrofolate dehydrogenase/methenyltetrahydrofolate cyclohydrolase FolD [Pseudomonadota bacterium]|nr:bifunctional methylenetetrahydrofolate dehydrogenase/methenyltetrahydrofolate cyclohydrolase FolD [Pseudomonadota bacterium]
MTKILDGKVFAKNLREELTQTVSTLQKEYGEVPGLAVVLVGNNPASEVYVRNKGIQTKECGMRSFEHKLPSTIQQEDLLKVIYQLNEDPEVDGILVQLPLPDQIDAQKVLDTIDPAKDVDGFHIINAGRLATGGEALVPCTPLGCLLLLKDHFGDLTGKDVVVIGRSNIVGKPMAALLIRESCTVTIAHSKSQDLKAICKRADILIAAVGRPEIITGDFIKKGAVVLDVGINRIPAPEKGEGKTKLVGDVAFEEAKLQADAITPVPGGIGPMTIAVLLRNTIEAACRRRNWVYNL